MLTEIRDTKLSVLTGRIANGLEYCNSTWQRAKGQADNTAEYEKTMALLDLAAKRLRGLIRVAQAYGLNKCVFGSCKWNEDNFICFGCIKTEKEEKQWSLELS